MTNREDGSYPVLLFGRNEAIAAVGAKKYVLSVSPSGSDEPIPAARTRHKAPLDRGALERLRDYQCRAINPLSRPNL